MRNALIVLGLALALQGCRGPSPGLGKRTPDTPYLVVLGTAQDGGLPQIACRRPCCEAARSDPQRRRFVTSLLVVDPRTQQRWIFDASPDLPLQVELARGHGVPSEPGADALGRPALFDGVFLTHAHIGHYAGLIQFGREAYGSAPVDLIGTARMIDFLSGNGPWSLLFDGGHANGVVLEPGEPMTLTPDLSVTAVQVPHRDEFSDTVGFLIAGPRQTALYLPDIDKWSRWDQPLETVLENVDLAFVDGTFFGPDELPGRDMSEVPHPFIVETLGAISTKVNLDKVHFTHLNHSNPAADPASEAADRIRAAGAHVLREGALFPL